MSIGALQVDVCQNGCGGVWFDNFEIQHVDEPHEFAGEQLLHIPRQENISIDYTAKRHCPRCPDILMMKHYSSIQHKVEIDECGQCGGIWLDMGELAQIRSLYESEEEKNKAANAYIDKVAEESLAEIRAQGEQDLARAQKFAHMLRFLCPSYYIPGEQDWGAF